MPEDVLYSVLGEVHPSEMQWVQPHEHLLVMLNEARGDIISELPGTVEYVRRQTLPMLKDLRKRGVNGFVDPLPMGYGRDSDFVAYAQSMSRATGMHIFLTTGLYLPSRWPAWAREMDASQLADVFSRDLEDGIGDTGVRPSIIKAGIGLDFGADHERMLSAVAMAHKRTGAALHIHSTGCRRETIDFLTSQGVDLSRVYLAHVDSRTSKEEYSWLAEQGVRFITTNWEFPYHIDPEENRQLLRFLIDKGHLDKILISIDFSYQITRYLTSINNWNNPERTSYSYLHTGVLPKLRAAGVTETQLEVMMHDNPVEMLHWK